MKSSSAKLKVKARPGSRFTNADIREAYAVLTTMAGGPTWPQSLTPKAVLDAVLKDPNHPLRKHLELDTRKAAYQHWLTQVRYLMSEVRVSVIHDRPEPREGFARVLHPMPTSKARAGGFRPINLLRKEEKSIGILSRTRVTYLKQWAAATENLIASIESPEEVEALTSLLASVVGSLEVFELSMRAIEDQAAE